MLYPATGLQVCKTTVNLKTNTYPSLNRFLDSGQWVDRDQLNSFMHEYHWSSDKTQFLNEKREQRHIIYLVWLTVSLLWLTV